MRLSQAIWALCSPAAAAMATSKTIKIDAPRVVPSDASQPVAHDFASISIPIHFFAEYAGMFTVHSQMNKH